MRGRWVVLGLPLALGVCVNVLACPQAGGASRMLALRRAGAEAGRLRHGHRRDADATGPTPATPPAAPAPSQRPGLQWPRRSPALPAHGRPPPRARRASPAPARSSTERCPHPAGRRFRGGPPALRKSVGVDIGAQSTRPQNGSIKPTSGARIQRGSPAPVKRRDVASASRRCPCRGRPALVPAEDPWHSCRVTPTLRPANGGQRGGGLRGASRLVRLWPDAVAGSASDPSRRRRSSALQRGGSRPRLRMC